MIKAFQKVVDLNTDDLQDDFHNLIFLKNNLMACQFKVELLCITVFKIFCATYPLEFKTQIKANA